MSGLIVGTINASGFSGDLDGNELSDSSDNVVSVASGNDFAIANGQYLYLQGAGSTTYIRKNGSGVEFWNGANYMELDAAGGAAAKFNARLQLSEITAPGGTANTSLLWAEDNASVTELKATCGTGGNEVVLCDESGNMALGNAQVLYLDDDRDSYIRAQSDDVFNLYLGGGRKIHCSSSILTLETTTTTFDCAARLNQALALTPAMAQAGTVAVSGTTNGPFIGCDCTSPVTVNLPSSVTNGTLWYIFDDGSGTSGAGTNNITINRGSTHTIGTAAATTYTISVNNGYVWLLYTSADGNYKIIDSGTLG